jgi:TolB protein
MAWAAVVAAGAGMGWWLGASRARAPDATWSTFTQLTEESGREVTPSISPDGLSIAYASDVSGSWDIYVRRIGGRTTTGVAADPARHEGAPAFSADGRSIAFHEADTDGGIFVVGATGESERRVSDVGFHPAWSPDGRSIAFCQERIILPTSRVVISALSVVDVDTGAIRVVTTRDAVQPAWSPSGERLAYWGQSGGQRDIYTVAATGGDPVKVTDDVALDWSVAWAPDGRHLYFSSDRGGSMNLWRVPVDQRSGQATGPPEPVTSGVQATIAGASLSQDGRRMIFTSSIASTNPVALPIDPVTGRVGAPRFLFRQSGIVAPTSVSPDGSTLAYFVAGRSEDIWLGRVDGSGLRRLTDDDHRDRVPMWSADGNELVFYSNRSGKYEVWTIKKDGSGLRQRSFRPNDNLNWAFYDPAGDRLWASSATAGSSVAFTFPLGRSAPGEGAQMPAIAVDGGILRAHGISRDGRRLIGLALSTAGARLGIGWHDLAAGETWVSREGPDIGIPAWLDDRRAVFAVDGRYLAVVDSARQRRVIGGPFPFELHIFMMPAVSPDGRTVYAGASETEADVWMVERQR